MDTYKEQIVKIRRTGASFMLSTLVWFCAMAITAVLILLIAKLAVIIAFLLFYGAMYITQRFNIEYEYILTNGELDVDKILAQRSRSRLFTIKCADIEAIGRYQKGMKLGEQVYMCCNADDEAYYMRARDKKGKPICIVIAPDEKMKQAIKPYLSRIIQREAFEK
ncbi:MAG: hypothetical protein IKL62_00375 [Clostridia bacterium]|nr:hypothetical protein [Oscillospiraceae bacterium]MBR6693390.1 hypothetical protein [Clostridia bacterium]